MNRREFELLAGGMAAGEALRLAYPGWAEAASKADFQIRIAPVSVELAPAIRSAPLPITGRFPVRFCEYGKARKPVSISSMTRMFPNSFTGMAKLSRRKLMAPKRKAARRLRRTGACASTSRPRRLERVVSHARDGHGRSGARGVFGAIPISAGRAEKPPGKLRSGKSFWPGGIGCRSWFIAARPIMTGQ